MAKVRVGLAVAVLVLLVMEWLLVSHTLNWLMSAMLANAGA
jgi:hypothetical protein